MKYKHLIWSILAWSIFLIISFVWNYNLVATNNKKLVLNKSRAFFEQILVTRVWNAEHGGVYVPVTSTTLPNQYLEDSLRDVTTTEGLRLTKINPAFMTRQIAETNKLQHNLHFHITSLNPIRPGNKADDWEAKSLKMFENGMTENIELIKNESFSQYRYMAPLKVEKSCLKCHEKQGYKLGEIRGGISISFPADEYTDSVNNQLTSLGFAHFIILFIGIAGLMLYSSTTNTYLQIIQKRNDELLEINATKDKFFSIIGHDLKAPFNGILGVSQVLIEEINNKNYELVENYAKIMHDSSKRAFSLLGNLLEWSRSQSGSIKFNPTNFDIAKEIIEIKELFNESAMQKKINIQNEIKNNIYVYADKEMINTVLRNLISNAVKFTDIGGKIIINADIQDNNIFVKITDNGIGIPKERVGDLFTIKSNYSTPGTQNEQGTGLGLLLCKEFIEKNNGEIEVESTLGEGSKFYFTLPLSNFSDNNSKKQNI